MDELVAGLRALPNIHPLVVYFPIALLPTSLLLDLVGVMTGRRDFDLAARWTLWLGTLAAALGVYTGHEAADLVRPQVSAEAGAMMTTHHDIAIAVLVTAAVLSIWRLVFRERLPRRWHAVYLVMAIGLVAALAVAADLGGRMVFLHAVAVRRVGA